MRSETERKALGRFGEEDKGGRGSRMGQVAEKTGFFKMPLSTIQ